LIDLSGILPCGQCHSIDSSPRRRTSSSATKFNLFDIEEIIMNKQKGLGWVRGAAESVFAGVIAAAVMTFIASGTLAMCLPGVLAA
jgi:hypothetical protein